jgi:hypothetical protein
VGYINSSFFADGWSNGAFWDVPDSRFVPVVWNSAEPFADKGDRVELMVSEAGAASFIDP